MKKGKFQKKKAHASGMKRTALIVLCLVMLGATIGATIAYLQAQTSGVVNTFKPGKVEISIEETFDQQVKEHVTIKNPGPPVNDKTVPSYIRAAIVVNWADAHGNILGQKPGENDYAMSINTADWTKGSDGYYYYNKGAVNPGASTSDLIINAEQLEAAPVDGYYLSIDILASGVQSMPDEAVAGLWGDVAAGLVGAK